MKNHWFKNIGAFLFILILSISLGACGSSSSSRGPVANSNGGTTPLPSTPSTQYVAVGNAGTVITSTDKDNWSIGLTGSNDTIWDVASGSWVAVGIDLSTGEGLIARTDDAGQVINEHSVQNAVFFGIANDGAGMWVAVGGNITPDGVTSTSDDDGVTWTDSTLSGVATLFEIAHGNGHWVAVGMGGTIIHSPDGVNWTSTSAGTNDLVGVAYGNDNWIAVGVGGVIFHATTADLDNWSNPQGQFTAPRDLTDIAYDGSSRWVTVGNDGIIFYSDDNGDTWTESKDSNIETQNNLMGVVYDGTDWVAVGAATVTATEATIIHTRAGDIDVWDRSSNAPAINENLNSIAVKVP